MTRTCHVCADEYGPEEAEYEDGLAASYGDRWLCPYCCGPAFAQGTTHCDLCLRAVGDCGSLVDGACRRCWEQEDREGRVTPSSLTVVSARWDELARSGECDTLPLDTSGSAGVVADVLFVFGPALVAFVVLGAMAGGGL